MFLAVYVYRQLGLTIDLTEDHTPILKDAVREGPAFDRLTAVSGSLRDPARLTHWLAGFLPENGTVASFQAKAAEAWQAFDGNTERFSYAAVLWGNADAEYTGAVDFRPCDDHHPPPRLPAPDRAQVEPLSEQEVGRRLKLAASIADNTRYVRPWEPLRLSGRRSSLSGMRGKLGLANLPGDRWGVATGDGLNTWICKYERRSDLPGEAGLEAICQRTLQHIGIPAARTTTRVFDGNQAVLSQRTDRTVDADGIVTARHQEEWVQAACARPGAKHGRTLSRDSCWPQAHRILRLYSTQPSEAQATLHRVIMAAWLLGNGDLHRRNVGFLHAEAHEPGAVDLAPIYDFSSSAGTEYTTHPTIPIHQAFRADRVTPIQWLKLSEQCGLPGGVALAAIGHLIQSLPDALVTGREQARTEDQTLDPHAVDRRVNAVIRHVRTRTNQWREQALWLAKRARRARLGAGT